MVQREAALAGLEAAERGDVDARALGDLLEGQPPLRAELPQPPAGADVDGLLLRSLPAWQISLADRAGAVTLRGMEQPWDCIVVGAGAAGLSAALVLGRARQRTLVVDAGNQSNRAAHGIGGFLGQDGRPPDAFYAASREELAAYPTVELRSGEVLGGAPDEGGFVLELAGGTREATRRVLLATGMEYRLPALPGVAERWGRSVFHCPFCHGWEVRDRPLGVLDRAPPAYSGRSSCASGATTSRCSPAGPPSSTTTTPPRGCGPPGSRSTSARSRGCAARTAR